jgi:hypothetical protein
MADIGILQDDKTKYEILLPNSPNICKLSIKCEMLAIVFKSLCYAILLIMVYMTDEAVLQ